MRERPNELPRLLIGESERRVANALRRELINDYSIRWAKKGSELLESAASSPRPALILINVDLPEGDGYRLCFELKRKDSTRNIPILLVLPRGSKKDVGRAFEVGGADYVTVPIESNTVKSRVRTHIELGRLRQLAANALALDPLTEVADQRGVEEFVEVEWNRAARDATSLSLLLLQVDSFQGLIDTRGRLAGDECLLQISTEIASTIRRPMDFMGRYGDEGFAVILPATEAYGAAYLAETIRQQVGTLDIPNPASKKSKWVTVSLGITTAVPFPGGVPAPLFEAATKGLEAAKNQGGNCYKQVEPAFE